MQVSREFHAHSGNYTPGGNSCQYIVVHNTGNTASARSEASYAQNNRHDSSYHYVLDGSNPVYQILDDTDTAWAVGAWSGCTAYIRNNQSISIEVCSNGTPFTSAEISQLTELVGYLMSKHGIPASRVVRHYDCHSGHKNCPAAYTSQGAWNELHAIITGGEVLTGDDIRAISTDVWVGFHCAGQDTPFNQIFSELPKRVASAVWVDWKAAGNTQTPFNQLFYNARKPILEDLENVKAKQAELESKVDRILELLEKKK